MQYPPDSPPPNPYQGQPPYYPSQPPQQSQPSQSPSQWQERPVQDDASQLSGNGNWQTSPPYSQPPSSPEYPQYAQQPQASYPQAGPYQPYPQQSFQQPPVAQQAFQQPVQPMQPQQQMQPQWGPPQQQQMQPQWGPPQQQQMQPQPFPQGYPQQSMYPPQPMPMMQPNGFVPPATNVVMVNVNQKQHSFLVRVLYFIFIGYWFGFIWLNVGYFLCFTIILFPVGLMMLNRLPQVLTLRSSNQQVNVTVAGNVTTINMAGTQQYNFFIRALYFLFIGSWLGYFWACVGYGLCVTLLGMPLGLIMLNRLPFIITLRRN